MAPAVATTRLRRELVQLQKDPPPGVIAEPDESNILKWHYAIKGPTETGFHGGTYVGKLIFPNEYPMKPPGIMMLTPSGRFKCNMRLCLSMSDYHPESWNPMWSVATIIQGVQSFMASDELTTGGMKSTLSEQKRLAAESIEYNKKMFPTLFGGDIEGAFRSDTDIKNPNPTDSGTSSVSPASTTNEDTTSQTEPPKTTSTNARRGKRDKEPPAAVLQAPSSTELQIDDECLVERITLEEDANDDHDPEEISATELEKRRERNAKRRAKQKQKRQQDAVGSGDAS